MACFKYLKCYIQINRCLSNYHTININRYICNQSPIRLSVVRHFSITIKTFFSQSSNLNSTLQSKFEITSKKKRHGPKITLIRTDESLIVTSFEEAEKLAKREDLKLVKITDRGTKSPRQIYRLMTGAQYFEEDLKQRKLRAEKRKTDIKGDKLLSISSKISEHDLQGRLNKIKIWLKKNYEARIIINATGDESKAERIVQIIQDSVKDEGNVVQLRKKDSDVKFTILPLKKKDETPQE